MNSEYPRCTSKLRNDIRDLHTVRSRRETQTFLVEGPHACEELAQSHAIVQCVVLRDDADPRSRACAEVFEHRGTPVYAVGGRDMERMSDTTSPRDILAVVVIPESAPLGNRIVVLDGVADPGNVGTIIRTAAWFGFTDVVLLAGCADPYAPKVVRSSVGSLMHVNMLRDVETDALRVMLGSVPMVAAVTRDGEHPRVLRSLPACAVVVGSEAHGVRPELLSMCAHTVTIPGSGSVESLNASIACAVLMYEAQ
jgi:TrmH family RNA methyltransferase